MGPVYIFNLVQYHFKQPIDTDSINYSRFLVHMQFFLQRLQEESWTARGTVFCWSR
jgi:hypothetical protein